MLAAPLGDDVFADDPSVNALQQQIAQTRTLLATLGLEGSDATGQAQAGAAPRT